MKRVGERGVTLLDAVVGTALMLVVFLGITGAFTLSVDVVINNKARSGAIALAGERMEYVRSIAYTALGTVGGIPSGTIPQSETVVMNGVTYTRRTVVEYGDDPKDGTGAGDTNAIPQDYKIVKVDLAWTTRSGARHVVIVSRFESPAGLEIACTPCGTLTINAVDSASVPLSNASVSIVNASTSPATNISTFTNASGTATIIGAPVASGYAITVTKPGYSTAQTYSVSATNTNPNPGNLTVANGQTTAGSFAIDLLGTKTVRSWTQVLAGSWTDAFGNGVNVASSSRIDIAGGEATLLADAGAYPADGAMQSVEVAPANIYKWKTFTVTSTIPAGTEIRYRFYDFSGNTLIPDSLLPGNSAGFATTTMSISSIATSTFASLRIGATFTTSDASTTPSIDSYTIQYDYGPSPLPGIAFTMVGQKTIGSGPSGTVFKYNQDLNTGVSSSLVIPNLEWDVYSVSVDGAATGYDIVSSCPGPQPETFNAGAASTTDLYFTPHTTNSLLVNVRSAATGALLPDATVHLWLSPGYAATSTADKCGHAFFGGLAASPTYSLSVSAVGYATATSTANVSGTSQTAISLN